MAFTSRPVRLPLKTFTLLFLVVVVVSDLNKTAWRIDGFDAKKGLIGGFAYPGPIHPFRSTPLNKRCNQDNQEGVNTTDTFSIGCFNLS